MDSYNLLPQKKLQPAGPLSSKFLELGIDEFSQAANYVHEFPYGYNSTYEDPFILFKEGKGTCTSKHAVIAGLAKEIGLSVSKHVGIYKMTEDIVAGTQEILNHYKIPYIPMIHCFLVYNGYRFDLTEGNKNGKKRSIENFIHHAQVEPLFLQKDEYLLLKKVLKEIVLLSQEMVGISELTLLKAREEGLKILKSNM
jgi:hypothetical protein